jgi:uncharacterized OsmC-like protein
MDAAAVERALVVSEEQLCPVWIMLKEGTPIRRSLRIVDGEGGEGPEPASASTIS